MENSGFKIIGEPPERNGAVAIIVVGLNRGGTSAIAASLHALDIHVGNCFHLPNYEDVELAHAFRQRDWRQVQAIIRAYESEHPRFAWKLPDVYAQLARVNKFCSNPRYIFVYRDIFAISRRRELVRQTDTVTSMMDCLDSYAAIVKFIKKTRPYGLHVSYEKVLQHKAGFAQMLCTFCDIPADPGRLAAVQNCIEPSPEGYLQWTDSVERRKHLKLKGYEGNLDVVNDRCVNGWAKQYFSNAPVNLEIFVNQQFHGRAVADLFRQDLVLAGVSPHGLAGFRYEFGQPIAKGDVVAVKIENTGFDLIHSPKACE